MENVLAAGIIIFFNRKKPEYLLLHYRKWNYWGFCKGWAEDETLLETALRELHEETGITDVNVIYDFHEEVSYTYTYDGKRIFKIVHYFLGEVFDKFVELSTEHDSYQWASFEEAMNLLTHESDKRVLRNVHEFLLTYQA